MRPLHQKPEARLLLLPPELPVPKFQFGQQVQWRGFWGRYDYGIVRGLQYWTPRMSEELANNLDWVGWSYLVEVDPSSPTSNGIEDVQEADLELREVQLR